MLLFDVDTGQPIGEVFEKIKGEGWFALVWPTHSHNKCETDITEKALLDWMRKAKRGTNPTAADAVAYLEAEKKARPSLFEGATLGPRQQRPGGTYLTLQHKPWAKHRIMLLLQEPFIFLRDGMSHEAAMQLWKDKYAAVAQRIGLEFDKSCADPSRLMYTPRIPTAAVIGEGGHQMLLLAGAPVDLAAIEVAEPAADPRAAAAGSSAGRAQGDDDFSKVKNFRRFMAVGFPTFDAVTWWKAVEPDSEKWCPWHEAHTPQPGKKDTGFRLWGQEETGDNWNCQCSHGCGHDRDRGQGANGKQDRAKYLYAKCVQVGVTDAAELLDYCDPAVKEAWEAQDAEHPQSDEPLFDVDEVTGVVTYSRVPTLKEALASGHSLVWGNWGFNNQYDAARRILEAANANNPTLFKRPEGGFTRLVEVEGRLKLEDLRNDSWSAEVHSRIEFRIFKETSDGAPINCVVPASRDLMTRLRGTCDYAFPTLDSFIRTPIFGPNGELRTARGYQADLQVYLDPRGEFDAPAAKPTRDDVVAATAIIEEAFLDFPFSDRFDGEEPLPYKVGEPGPTGYRQTHPQRGYASRWNMYGALLHPQVRHLMPKGAGAPGYHIDKNEPGEGAGLLMDTLSVIASGDKLPIRTYTPGGEFEKSITSSLRSGDSIVGIDNIAGTIDSGPLAAMLTAGRWKAREFHSNTREVDIPTRAQWLFAGNSFGFSNELAQRMVPIRIDSGYPDPATVRDASPEVFFKHVEQVDWLRTNRRRLVWALHTWIAHWFAQGRPGATVRQPRFPEYSAIVGGILELVAGACEVECGFLRNLQAYRQAVDEGTDAARAWLQEVFNRYGYSDLTAMDIIGVTRNPVGVALVDLPLEFKPDGSCNMNKANALIKNMILKKPCRVDVSKKEQVPTRTLRLIRVRERSPATFRLVPVLDAAPSE